MAALLNVRAKWSFFMMVYFQRKSQPKIAAAAAERPLTTQNFHSTFLDPRRSVRVISPIIFISDPFAAASATSDSKYFIFFFDFSGTFAMSMQLRLAPQSTKKSTVVDLSTRMSTCGLLSFVAEYLMAAILDVMWIRSLPSSIFVPS